MEEFLCFMGIVACFAIVIGLIIGNAFLVGTVLDNKSYIKCIKDEYGKFENRIAILEKKNARNKI